MGVEPVIYVRALYSCRVSGLQTIMFSRITRGVINAHFPASPSELLIKQVWEVLRNPPS